MNEKAPNYSSVTEGHATQNGLRVIGMPSRARSHSVSDAGLTASLNDGSITLHSALQSDFVTSARPITTIEEARYGLPPDVYNDR